MVLLYLLVIIAVIVVFISIFATNIQEQSHEKLSFPTNLDLKLNNFGITTIITTAPQPSIPSTKLIEKCLNSLNIIPLLANSPLIIGFDGCDVIDDHLDVKCKNEFDCGLYHEYKENVKTVASKMFPQVIFVELPARGCLTNLLHACMEKVTTKFVNVMQQDLPINKEFDLENILQIMNTNDDMELIRYSRDTNKFHEDYTFGECKGVFPTETITRNGINFTQCSQWSDNNHVAKLSHYDEIVWPRVAQFSFMEHDLMCYPYKENFKSIWYLGDIDDGGYIIHTDGRYTEN